MGSPERFFLEQLNSHRCQLPPSDDLEYISKVSRLKNKFLISEKSLLSYLRVKSLSGIFYEKRRQLRTSRCLVIHPFSELQKFWQLWMFVVFLASLLLFPFFSAFHGPFYARYLLRKGHNFTAFYIILAVLVLLQMAGLVHVVVSFFDGYFNPRKDEVVIHLPGIAKRYLSTFFLVDVVSSLPLDAMLVLSCGVEAYSQLSWAETTILSGLPLLKFCRLATMSRYFRKSFGNFYHSYATYNMVVVMALFFLFIHWCGCLFVIIQHWMYFRPLFDAADFPIVTDSVLHQYVTCLYVCLTAMVNSGFDIRQAKVVAPRWLLLVVIIVGKVYRIVVLIVFLQMMSTLMVGRLKYMEMMDQVRHYMHMKRFPRLLRRKVEVSYTYLFRKEFIGEKGILQLVSDNLRKEILLRMHQNLIQKVVLFSGLGENLILDFLTFLKPEIYMANDLVYKAGDVGECMYFISFGTVAVYSGTMHKEIGHLHDGDHFGEISLLFQLRRTSTVTALEATELYRLESQDFLYVIKAYPDIYERLEGQARRRYAQTQDSGYTQEGEDLKTKWRRAEGGGGAEGGEH